MGLINEVAQVAETMNRREQGKRERENKKLLIYEYNLEITGDLQALFYNLFEKFDIKTAYKKAIIEKEQNIDNLTTQIENITYFKPHTKLEFFKYKDNFDIVNDLNDKYFIILDRIYKEYKRLETVQNSDILNDLYKYLYDTFAMCENKTKCFELLQQENYIKRIIDELTEDDATKQQFLYNNYFKILHKVKKFYNGYIIQEKEEVKAMRERAKIKRRDNIITLAILNKILK